MSDTADSGSRSAPHEPSRGRAASSRPTAQQYTPRHVRIGAVVAVAAVVAFLVWYFAIRDGGGGNTSSALVGVGPVAASQADLVDLSGSLDQPVYWAGKQPGTTQLELTQTQDGNVYVRYLTNNAPVSSAKPSYLTVGTYPFPDAYHALQVIAKRPGGIEKDVADDGLVVTNRNSPKSVYLAYPDQDVQVEVYDPHPAKALELVTSGAIAPVR